MFQTKVVEKIKTHILCSITFLRRGGGGYGAIYEIMLQNNVELGRLQMTVLHKCIACWVPKSTNIYPECIILIALPVQQWLFEHASLLHCTYIACLVLHGFI